VVVILYLSQLLLPEVAAVAVKTKLVYPVVQVVVVDMLKQGVQVIRQALLQAKVIMVEAQQETREQPQEVVVVRVL
jgi:hypothetical protein